MNLEKYISDLSPELQEKARKCGSVEELLSLAEAEKVPLPDEAMEAIAGGKKHNPKNCGKAAKCPKCGSKDLTLLVGDLTKNKYKCNNCGCKFWASPL